MTKAKKGDGAALVAIAAAGATAYVVTRPSIWERVKRFHGGPSTPSPSPSPEPAPPAPAPPTPAPTPPAPPAEPTPPSSGALAGVLDDPRTTRRFFRGLAKPTEAYLAPYIAAIGPYNLLANKEFVKVWDNLHGTTYAANIGPRGELIDMAVHNRMVAEARAIAKRNYAWTPPRPSTPAPPAGQPEAATPPPPTTAASGGIIGPPLPEVVGPPTPHNWWDDWVKVPGAPVVLPSEAKVGSDLGRNVVDTARYAGEHTYNAFIHGASGTIGYGIGYSQQVNRIGPNWKFLDDFYRGATSKVDEGAELVDIDKPRKPDWWPW